jgi:predicted O-methyltransferase YrrM
LEVDPGYAEVARRNVGAAGLSDLVEIRVGDALDLLGALAEEAFGPLDLTFIDADKERTADYFAWALDRTRPGGLIVADNVVRDGTLAEVDSADPKVEAQRRLHETISTDPRVEATTIQTVGAKGYDGFTLALVNSS